MTQHRIRTSKLALGLLAALAAAPAMAQTTSAGVGGQVVGSGGAPVAGAEVTITHVESGTVSRATTDAAGRYTARGLRVGGPYTITITKPGEGTKTEEGVYLGLNQVSTVNAQIGSDTATTLGAVAVTASRNAATFNADNKGIGTNLTRADMDRMPSPDRSIQNIVRADPRIVVTDRDRGAFSAMGQNFRYNCITIDTIQAGDPYGLNDNGLPTKGTPISQDAIESYDLKTTDYDVTSRCVGAQVNAVTKSGSNEFHGSAYYTFQNADDMIGKDATTGKTKWTGYSKDVVKGGTFSGPIIKDKLFFFASYEKEEKTGAGSVYGPSDSNANFKVPGVTQADVDAVIAAATAKGLTPGNYSGYTADIESKRGLVKLDWNINDAHRVALRVSQTKEFEPILTAGTITGSNPKLTLSSNYYGLDKKNTSYALIAYDDWSDSFTTETSVGYNEFKQDRGPITGGFQPDIVIRTPAANGATSGPSIELGTEFSSQANALQVKSWNAAFVGNLFLDAHTLKFGADFRKDEVYNLFLQNYMGSYEFSSIADFNSGTYSRYRLSVPSGTLSLDDVSAQFTQKNYGLFLQDTWQATDRLSLQFGLRYDMPKVSPEPMYNPCFAADPGTLGNFGNCGLRANAANPNAATGGYGFTNQGTIDGNNRLQPRFSFNYDFDTERPTQLRGGAGLFVSNTPAVWLSNPYSNTGIQVTSYDINRRKTATDPAFSTDPYNQNVPGTTVLPPGLGSSSMNVSVVDPDFKLPTVAKYTLGLDHELPWSGIVFTTEYQHLDVVKGILYQNLNLGTPTGVLPDGRSSYARFPNQAPASANTTRWNANPSFGQQVIYLTNTDKGKSDSFTVSLRRPFQDNWSWMVGYTYSRVTEVNPGTSSVANSSFQNRDWIDPNADYEATSNYSIPNRVIAQLTWSKNLFGDNATTISAFYDGHDGAPYSWIFGNDVNGDSYSRDLAYIPSGPSDVVWANAASRAAAASFWEYVGNQPELSSRKGRIFDRNSGRAPWVNQLDVSFSQEIPGFMEGHKAVVRLDIFNFLNMLNRDWGVEKRASFPLERVLANYAGVDAATGKYIYDISSQVKNGVYQPTSLPVNESFTPSQRWAALLTLRYTF
ncbi:MULTISPECIES: TonB-dependent receptor [Pseudoxanthomonas]|uniref:Oar protein n=1 Tax=Pseudoxanthomonas winnipegensis TaxID=2480810 RepID=A0A4Q8LGY7_9GAMM|nr:MULTISPECIES: TonB-dependent receptor [Pseudoxanthomonas]PZP59705.1 MAG: Oar protein [Pseudoxanthomonas spadix]TAA28303.1 Oar protein [Pseudoxanthomonas winnipegensis]TMN24916.1 Oar protein [Pseudoxanthomonas sp. X-1]UAY73695.1 carboxypeptidase regulatory-like domain-containing protein [Pseudoxanthomonas sp. X-1]